MAAAEKPAKMHSDVVDVGDVIKLRRRKTVASEKRRGGLRRDSLVETKGDGESERSEGTSALPVAEEPIEEREESFSTGPFSKKTHWKQVVFLLKEPIELDRGAWLVSF